MLHSAASPAQVVPSGGHDSLKYRLSGSVELVAYAHSIEFGAKGHANLVELAALQHRVADALGLSPGRLLMIIKSAHVYETDVEYLRGAIVGRDSGPSS